MSKTLDQLARICHNANAALSKFMGDSSHPLWELASKEQKASAKYRVTIALVRPRMSAQDMHEEWVRYKRDLGWKYGPIKDEEAKLHPGMVPYETLSEQQRFKNELFLSLVKQA